MIILMNKFSEYFFFLEQIIPFLKKTICKYRLLKKHIRRYFLKFNI